MQQASSPLVSQHSSGNSYAEVSMIPVATIGPCYNHCAMIMPFMVSIFLKIYDKNLKKNDYVKLIYSSCISRKFCEICNVYSNTIHEKKISSDL